MTDQTNKDLPPLAGVLAALPERTREVIEAYGAACARTAIANQKKRAALSSAQQDKDDAERWQPIETAPKDGTHILVPLPDSNTSYVICWVDASKGIRRHLGPNVGWHHAYDGDYLSQWSQPTHWMPLPAPPIDAARAAAKGE